METCAIIIIVYVIGFVLSLIAYGFLGLVACTLGRSWEPMTYLLPLIVLGAATWPITIWYPIYFYVKNHQG